MPRIRSIKPELWQDERLGRCSVGATLLFIGCMSFADDEGRLRAAPELLKGQVFAYKPTTARNVSDWLEELSDMNLIRRYEVKGEQFVALPSWGKHQKIQHATESVLPAPPPITDALNNPHEDSRIVVTDKERDKDKERDRENSSVCSVESLPLRASERRKVNAPSRARGLLAEFNRLADTAFSSAQFVGAIQRRLTEHPELSDEAHGEIIKRNLASPWWKGNPSPSVIYGSAAQFERAMHHEKPEHPADRRARGFLAEAGA